MRFVFANAFCRFVAISQGVREAALKVGIPDQKIAVVYNGVDLKLFSCPTRDIRERVRSLVAIGRLTRQKGHATLVAAISLLKERHGHDLHPFPKTYVIGDGELKGALQQLVRTEGLEKEILFLGTRSDIPNMLKTYDVYVMSSEWEGLSISLIEAMASGLPVVVTDAGSNREIVDQEKDGLIVPVSAPEALAEAIHRLMKNHLLRQRFSKTGPEKASRFSIEACARNHLDLYRSVSLGQEGSSR